MLEHMLWYYSMLQLVFDIKAELKSIDFVTLYICSVVFFVVSLLAYHFLIASLKQIDLAGTSFLISF